MPEFRYPYYERGPDGKAVPREIIVVAATEEDALALAVAEFQLRING